LKVSLLTTWRTRLLNNYGYREKIVTALSRKFLKGSFKTFKNLSQHKIAWFSEKIVAPEFQESVL